MKANLKKFRKAAAVMGLGAMFICGNAFAAEKVDGTWSWKDGSIKPEAGTASYEATFTPSDTNNYETVTTNIEVTTLQYTPTISENPNASAITYGQSLSESIITGGRVLGAGGAEITGKWTWTDGTVNPSAGTREYEATFTPSDTKNYKNITLNISVVINKYTPVVSVNPTASAITYRQALSESTLSGATVDIEGTWSWKENVARPDAGTREYAAVFTPSNTSDYNPVEVNVSVTINKYRPTIKELPTLPDNIIYGGTLNDITLTGGIVE